MILQPQEIENLILNEIYSVLGADVLDMDEYPILMKVSDLDFKRGLLIYYSTRPYVNTISIDCVMKPRREVYVQEYRPSPDPDWFYIGINRILLQYLLYSNILVTKNNVNCWKLLRA